MAVSGARRDNCVVIAVRDNGKGIPKHLLTRVKQGGVSFGKPGGHGLGLAHAQALMKAHGGSLEIESETQKGTAVILQLPVARESQGARV